MSDDRPMDDIPSTNYLKVGGRIYSITEVANEQVDIEQELRSYYNEQYLQHIDRFNRGIVSGLTDEWDGQIQRLRDYSNRNSVAIPDMLMGKAVICLDSHSVEEIRVVDYSPNIWKMGRYELCNYIGARRTNTRDEETGRTTARYTRKKLANGLEVDLNQYRDDQVLIVTTERIYHFPAMYSYNAASDRLNCYNVNTFHSQGTSICTGGASARTFWNHNDFAGIINQVNHFSLGSRECFMRNSRNNIRVSIHDFVNTDTIQTIELEGDSEWRT